MFHIHTRFIFLVLATHYVQSLLCELTIHLVSSLSDSDMPDHDLEPPRFAQLALERVLQDWNALKSMIMFGSQENKDPYVSQPNRPPSTEV